MSKYEKTTNQLVVECPYCGYVRDPYPSENADKVERVEGCERCGQKYYLMEEMVILRHATPDCELNGIAHFYNKGVKTCSLCKNRKTRGVSVD